MHIHKLKLVFNQNRSLYITSLKFSNLYWIGLVLYCKQKSSILNYNVILMRFKSISLFYFAMAVFHRAHTYHHNLCCLKQRIWQMNFALVHHVKMKPLINGLPEWNLSMQNCINRLLNNTEIEPALHRRCLNLIYKSLAIWYHACYLVQEHLDYVAVACTLINTQKYCTAKWLIV
jgi:hypothetical protein